MVADADAVADPGTVVIESAHAAVCELPASPTSRTSDSGTTAAA